MKIGIVQRIFLDHFATYRKRRVLDPRQKCGANSIMTCRTNTQSYRIDECPNCDYHVIVNNSCKHRACSQCGVTDTQLWLERRKAQALDCAYFHIVFTISHDFHIILPANRKLFTSLMMRDAWHSLQELFRDWIWLGGLAGAIGVFQSWDDEMRNHCHLHFIVTTGGLNPDNRWVAADKEFLMLTPVLASKFCCKFIAYLKKGFSKLTAKGKEKPEKQICTYSDQLRCTGIAQSSVIFFCADRLLIIGSIFRMYLIAFMEKHFKLNYLFKLGSVHGF